MKRIWRLSICYWLGSGIGALLNSVIHPEQRREHAIIALFLLALAYVGIVVRWKERGL